MSSGATRQRVDIQGLRALAVLLVLADHVGVGLLAGGYVGVDVFFVISGFLISSLLFGEVQRSGRVSIAGFYARRARRILPAATLVLAATLAFVAVTAPLARVREAVTDVVWAAFFLANVNFAGQGQDYFDDVGLSPVQHFWSLAVEEQFYLVWPVLLLVVALVLRRRGRPAWNRRLVVAIVVVALAASLGWSLVLTATDPHAAYFSTAARAWELAGGALVALLVPRLTSLGTLTRVLLSGAGLLAVAVAAVQFDAGTPFPGIAAALPVLGTMALLTAGTGAEHPWPGRILTVRPGPWVGDISYSLYLWHWPVIILGREQFPEITAGRTGSLLLIGCSFVLASLSYHLVEEPFRRGKVPGLSRGRGALALWPVAVGCVIVAAAAAPAYTEYRAQSAEKERAAYFADPAHRVDVTRLDTPAQVRRALTRQVDLARSGAPLPAGIVNGADLEEDLWQLRYTCNAGRDESTVDLCPVGDQDADRTMVVYGDSHAGVWLPALDRIGARRGLRVVPLIKVGCAPFDVDRLRDGRLYPDCRDFHRWAERTMADLDPDLIVSSYRGMRPRIDVRDSGESLAKTWHDGVASALPRISRIAPTVLLSDYSFAPFRPRDCLSDPDAVMSDCVFDEDRRTRAGNRIVRQVALAEDVAFVDLSRLVCAQGRCPTVVGNVATFRDESHLTVTWVQRIRPALERLLQPWLPDPR